MSGRRLLWGSVGIVVLLAAIGGTLILSLPPTPSVGAPPQIPQEEADATLAALKPPKRPRPLVAIVALNDATETTDYLMPYGILRRADIADVVALATGPGPVTLYPALKVEPQATIAAFDMQHPDGADYVVVPAMSRDDDPAVLEWLRNQAGKGATIIGICAGAKILGEAGLLDGRRGTTHWYFVEELREKRPSMRYVADRRLVVDQRVVTTTGISASMPMALTLIEAIAGRAKAEETARDMGLAHWDTRHASGAFGVTRPFALAAMGNTLAFWTHETLGIELAPGVDEVSLALVADAWSRTYRSRALTLAAPGVSIESRNGMRILPDEAKNRSAADDLLPPIGDRPAEALEQALKGIADRYGARTADFVAMQLELSRPLRQELEMK